MQEKIGMSTSFSVFEPKWSTPTIAKDGKIVSLRGAVCAGSLTTNIVGTIPSGYRPKVPSPFRVPCRDGGKGDWVHDRTIIIHPNGAIEAQGMKHLDVIALNASWNIE